MVSTSIHCRDLSRITGGATRTPAAGSPQAARRGRAALGPKSRSEPCERDATGAESRQTSYPVADLSADELAELRRLLG